MFRLGTTYSSYGPLKLVKNNHILTAIGQFSKILFSEKQFSNILQNTIFFQAITFFKKASEIQGKIFRFFFQKKTFRRGLGGARPELEWSSRGARAELGWSSGGGAFGTAASHPLIIFDFNIWFRTH